MNLYLQFSHGHHTACGVAGVVFAANVIKAPLTKSDTSCGLIQDQQCGYGFNRSQYKTERCCQALLPAPLLLTSLILRVHSTLAHRVVDSTPGDTYIKSIGIIASRQAAGDEPADRTRNISQAAATACKDFL
eukprot:scaffold508836_cov52-Prasinocladus_malaysianus.AAC.1